MQKDNRNYTFLFTHSSRSKIYIRRVEISKKLVNACATAAVVVSLGAASFGFSKFFGSLPSSNSALASMSVGFEKVTKENTEVKETSVNQTVKTEPITEVVENKPTTEIAENKPINYQRQETSEKNNLGTSTNSGGPSVVFQLTNVESENEENLIVNQLNYIDQNALREFIPSMWPRLAKINNEFGFRRNPFGGRSYEFHQGIDIDGESGDPIVSPANGTVLKAGWQGGYGYLLELDHGNGLTTRYGHLSKIQVQVGDVVQRGQEIALVGSTGRSTGPHLHYELRLNDKPINPRRFLPPEPVDISNKN